MSDNAISSSEETTNKNEPQSSKTALMSTWIHCFAQIVMAATVSSYFAHLEKYFAFKHQAMKLPVFTEVAIHMRNALWLIPLVFTVVGFWILARRRGDTRSTSIFAACSTFAIVCIIAFAVLVTRAPFGLPELLGQR